MATIEDFEERQLENHLISGGFLGAFTDVVGTLQAAPITQLMQIDTTNGQASDRFILIRNTGGINNPNTRIHYKSRNMIIVIVGQSNASDAKVVKGLANDIEDWLVDNSSDGECMFNIQSSGVTGPFIYSDSRRAFEISLRADFNIVKKGF